MACHHNITVHILGWFCFNMSNTKKQFVLYNQNCPIMFLSLIFGEQHRKKVIDMIQRHKIK